MVHALEWGDAIFGLAPGSIQCALEVLRVFHKQILVHSVYCGRVVLDADVDELTTNSRAAYRVSEH
jgi:hypothetical protein